MNLVGHVSSTYPILYTQICVVSRLKICHPCFGKVYYHFFCIRFRDRNTVFLDFFYDIFLVLDTTCTCHCQQSKSYVCRNINFVCIYSPFSLGQHYYFTVRGYPPRPAYLGMLFLSSTNFSKIDQVVVCYS